MRYAQVKTVCVMNRRGNILFHRNMPNNFEIFNNYLKPFYQVSPSASNRAATTTGSPLPVLRPTFPSISAIADYMKAINGGKVKNDRVDSRKIADLLKANLFPLAYPYPRHMRSARDLLRRRHYFMRRRAATFSHLQTLCTQHDILDIPPKLVKDKRNRRKIIRRFDDVDTRMVVASDLLFIDALDPIIAKLEWRITQQADPRHHAFQNPCSAIPRTVAWSSVNANPAARKSLLKTPKSETPI